MMISGLLVTVIASGMLSSQDTVRYRIDFISNENEAWSVIGGDDRIAILTASVWISITARDTVGATLATIAIDSSTTKPSGTPRRPVASMQTTETLSTGFEARIVNGKVDLTSLRQTNSEVDDIVTGVLPLIYPGRGDYRAGLTWSDTIKTDGSRDEVVATGETITDWRVVSHGADSTVLSKDSRATQVRTQTRHGASVSSAMTFVGTMVLDAAGALRSGKAQYLRESTLITPEFSEPIPMKGDALMTVTRIYER
jgi:hypothetical protein